jgi:ribosome-binding factor A
MSRFRGASRADRVAEEIQHYLGMYFIEGRLTDERLGSRSITVSHVSMSDDLQHAKIYVASLGEDQLPKPCLEALNEHAFRIKKDIAHDLGLRHTPQVMFYEDKGLADSMRIYSMIQQISSGTKKDET